MGDAFSRGAFVIVAIMPVTIERRIRHCREQRGADRLADFVVIDRSQQPAPPAYAASIFSARSASHGCPTISCATSALKCGSVTTVTSRSGGFRTGAAASPALPWRGRTANVESLGLRAVPRAILRRSIRNRAAGQWCRNFPDVLLRLRDDIDIALRKCERLRNQRTLGTDEQFMTKLAGRRHRAERDVVAEALHLARGVQRDALDPRDRASADPVCTPPRPRRELRARGSNAPPISDPAREPKRCRNAAFSRALMRARL